MSLTSSGSGAPDVWLYLLGSIAHAQNACETPPPALTARTAVAWVSRQQRRAGLQRTLDVVQVRDLRQFAESADVNEARVLQWLGLRRSSRPPQRPWKVVIFDADADSLCHPLLDSSDTQEQACADPGRLPTKRNPGCGWRFDFATEGRGAPALQSDWRSLAVDGFCLVPLSRFLEETRADAGPLER